MKQMENELKPTEIIIKSTFAIMLVFNISAIWGMFYFGLVAQPNLFLRYQFQKP